MKIEFSGRITSNYDEKKSTTDYYGELQKALLEWEQREMLPAEI